MNEKKTGNVVTVTGHRPKGLFGYDLMDPRYTAVRTAIKSILVRENASAVWTGMALGTDMLAALAVFDLQDEGRDIALYAAVPFKDHKDPRWPEQTRALYDAILYRADRTDLVSNGPYSPAALERRNRHMVDRSDLVIAVYAGKPGGTANCVKYARRSRKPIWFVDPSDPGNPAYAPASDCA